MRKYWRQAAVPFWRWYWWSMALAFIAGLIVNGAFNVPPGTLVSLGASIASSAATFAVVYVVMRGHAAWFEWECQRAYVRLLLGRREEEMGDAE